MEPSKLKHEVSRELDLTASHQERAGHHQGREFKTVEEMLRSDAAENLPPPHLAERLAASISLEPKPRRSWWQKFIGQ
jgi:hypothetical protein